MNTSRLKTGTESKTRSRTSPRRGTVSRPRMAVDQAHLDQLSVLEGHGTGDVPLLGVVHQLSLVQAGVDVQDLLLPAAPAWAGVAPAPRGTSLAPSPGLPGTPNPTAASPPAPL